MPNYHYKATSRAGTVIEGDRVADNRDEVAAYLQSQDMIVMSIDEKMGFEFKDLAKMNIGGMPTDEKVVAVRQLATMLSAGLPIVQAIDVLIQQNEQTGFADQYREVYKQIQAGLPLSTAFARNKFLFTDLQLSLIEAGEKSGNLVEIMNQIAIDMRDSALLEGKIRGALIYPAVIMVTLVIVMVVLITFMVPAVAELYHDFGQTELPFVTNVLISISNFFTNIFSLSLLLIVIALTVIGYRAFYATVQGRSIIDMLMLRLPVFGDLIVKIQVLEMTRLLSMLVHSGIPIIDALKSTAKAVGNYHFQQALLDAADEVSKGTGIALPLARSKVVPPIVVRLISTGEETGKLDQILAEVASFYKDQVDEITSNLTKLLEPIILLIVGAAVGFLAIAVYYPIYSVAQFAV